MTDSAPPDPSEPLRAAIAAREIVTKGRGLLALLVASGEGDSHTMAEITMTTLPTRWRRKASATDIVR